MTLRAPLIALTLALYAGTASGAGAQAAPADPAAMARLVAAPRLDEAAAARLYRQAVIAGRVPELYRALEGIAGSSAPAERRAMALLARAAMQWQAGAADAALADATRAIALHDGPDGQGLQARLLDAAGRTADAAASYRRAAAATTDARERRIFQLRIAAIDAATRPAALVDLARAVPPVATPERVATVLALLGDPALALTVDSLPSSGYVRDLRLADRAMAAGRYDLARSHAWRAYGRAGDIGDRRYALAILIEACRRAGTLADAAAFLAQQPSAPAIDQARVDVLLELGRHDQAVALIDRSGDAALRSRLLSIFEATGRQEDVAAEYRRRIAAQPDRPEWVAGLALHALGRGDDAGARAVWQHYFDTHPGRIDLLTQAARQMIAMGLAEPARAMIVGAVRGADASVPLQFFLFDAAQTQGDESGARAALARLRQLLPPGSPRLSAVADGYERLGDPAEALAVLHDMEARAPALDYDQRVHIATLAYTTGALEESLTRWRGLWQESRLPARRAYLERQIVRAATRLDRLEPIARELETRIAAGTGGQGEIDLLVGVRMAQNKGDSAVAAVRAYAARAGLGDVPRLEQLAALYVRLKNRPAVKATLRELVRADPANADLYLRRLTLDTVRYAEGDAASRQAEVERLLAELRTVAGLDDADATRFAAGVYAMASINDRAAAQYRRALALAPTDGDAMLQLAQLTRAAGRRDEAIAMLQSAADGATDEAALATAIDALIDLAALPDDAPAADAATRDTVLAWARRRLIAHILDAGSGVRIDTTLADLAQEQGDFALQRRTYDDMLALSGDQKPAVLRQLITLTSGTSGREETSGPTLGDSAAKRAYGRRLLALHREYPADFYADLARTMLAADDVAGAEAAFAMMNDVGGLVNVDQVRGDAYAKAGRPDQALRDYGRALLRDRDDVALIVKASVLREQRGERALANRWYWQGLRALAMRQPVRIDTSGDAALEMREFGPTLDEGLLLTWPPAAADAGRIVAELHGLTQDAAARVDPAAGRPLSDHPRLAMLVALERRIAEYRGDTARIAALDAMLDPLFVQDRVYRDSAAFYRDLVGLRTGGPAPAATDDAEWVMRGLAIQARDGANADLDLALTLAGRDPAAIAAWTAHAIASETAARAQRPGNGDAADPELLYAMLVKGGEALPPPMLRALVLEPLSRTAFRDEVMFDLFRTAPDRYARIAAQAPDLVPGDDVLLTMMMTRAGRPLPQAASTLLRRNGDVLDGMLARFPVDPLIGLYERLVTRMEAEGNVSGFQGPLIAHLLRQPLDATQQARLLATIRRDLAADDADGLRNAGRLVPFFLVADAPPANRPLLLDAARALAQRYPLARHLPDYLDARLSGDRAAAFAALNALHADTATEAGGVDYATPLNLSDFRAETRNDIAAFLADPHPGPERIARVYRDYVRDAERFGIGSDVATLLRLYTRLLAIDPADATYRLGLFQMLAERDRAQAAAVLRPYVDAHPDAADAAGILQMLYALLDRPDQAHAVARASGVSIDDTAALTAIVNRMGSARTTPLGQAFDGVFGAYRERFPTAPAIVAIGRQRTAQAAAPGLVATDAVVRRRLADAFAQSVDKGRATLRGLWRDSLSQGDEPAEGAFLRSDILLAIGNGDGQDAAPLRAILIGTPAVTDDLDAMLRALEPEIRQRQPKFQALVADGLIAQDRAANRIAALDGALAAGTIDGHGLALFTTLLERTGATLPPARRSALVAQLGRMPALSASQRVQLATLFARSGDPATAGALLTAATMQVLMPTTVDFQQNVMAVISPTAIVKTLASWPDRDAARRTRAAIVALVAAEQGAQAAAALASPAG